jgi:cytochrome b subunit of formate dehydrogenase
MPKKITMSLQTRTNWLIDLTVFVGGLLASLSGIYFLFLSSGGYQGGRNSMYGVTILFNRHMWDDLHTWTGVAMIVAAVIHFAIHWQWVKTMTRRTLNALLSKGSSLSNGAKLNVAIDVLVALSFFVTAVSGLYFLFVPTSGFEGGRNTGQAGVVLFSSTMWDLIHTWAGVVMISAVIVHLWIHWRWVANVTSRFLRSPRQQPKVSQAAATTNI